VKSLEISFLIAKAAGGKIMLDHGAGRIINISSQVSVAGLTTYPYAVAFTVSVLSACPPKLRLRRVAKAVRRVRLIFAADA